MNSPNNYAAAPESFAYSKPGEFLTQPELFQRMIGVPQAYWVAVLPEDYDTKGGVYQFAELAQAVTFAATKQDEDCTCFMFQGIYIPMTAPLLPGSVGTDPELTPLVELEYGKAFELEQMQRFRSQYHRGLTLAALADQSIEEVQEQAVEATEVVAAPAEASIVAVPEVEVAAPVVNPPVIVETTAVVKPPEDDDFAGLPGS